MIISCVINMDMPEHYEDKLRDVFQLCDSEKKGYISVQHFVSLAKEHFGAEGQGEEVCVIHVECFVSHYTVE